VSLALAVTVRPLVEILDATIWKNKWSAAIPLMQVFAIAAPVRMFSDVVSAALASRGDFRRSAWLTLAEGAWLMLSAGVAVALVGADLAWLAVIIGSAQVAFSIASSVRLLRGFGIAPAPFVAAFLPPWLGAVAAAGAAAAALAIVPNAAPIVRLLLGAVVFGAAFLVIARQWLRPSLEELIRVMPARAGRWFERALLLRGVAAA
jgi:hypothetical protein